MTNRPSPVALVAAFAAVYVIWGSTYLAISWGVAEIPPFLMAGVRFIAAGLVFAAWGLRRGAARPTARDWAMTGLVGVLMAAGGNGGVSWALQRVPSGLGALLVSMVPFWVALGDWWRPGGERPAGRVVLGLVLGFSGIALLVNPAEAAGASGLDPVGAGAIVLASLLWAAGSICSRHVPQPHSQALSSGMQMLGGGVVLLALSAAAGELRGLDWGAVSPGAFAAWAYVAAFGSVAYGCYLWLLKASVPAKAATYAYVNPVIALVLGYFL
ncbi:MAG: EamA family transporter, partial [Bryobacterales bacterium]|nr:EamA family transporter [Bryobacterales bacterium]